MSYQELSRRELQRMCKECGLPANKTNAAMASSLTSFLGDPSTNVLARAPQVFTLAVVKKSNRAKTLPKTEVQDQTSLAALLLAAKPRDLVSHGKLLKKGRDFPQRRNIKADLSAFIVPACAKTAADSILPKTTPLLRRSRNHDVIPPTGAEEMSLADFARDCADLAENLSFSHEEISILAGETVKSTPEPAVPDTTGYQTKRCCQKYVQPALSPLFRITANVDRLINRATAMLEKFQEWKGDFPQGPGTDIAVGT